MFFPFQLMGKYEEAAHIRERNALWERRNYLNVAEAARLDSLIRSFGEPVESTSKAAQTWTLEQLMKGLK
jgi:hypothetical protein